jgi:hypothetical protein
MQLASRIRLVCCCLSTLLLATAQSADDSEEAPTSSMSSWVFTGSVGNRPGAGVRVREEVRRPGRKGAGRLTPSSPGASPARAPTRATNCVVWDAPWALAWIGNRMPGTAPVEEMTSATMQAGNVYYRECRYADDGTVASYDRFTYQPGQPGQPFQQPPDVEAIARQVYEEVPLVLPQPHTSPPADAPQLVGFPVWLWVDGTVWRDFEASASVAGVSVSVVAHPDHIEWSLGDGSTVTCAGPGTAWDSAGGDTQSTDCSHIYQFVSTGQPSGRYQASVTVFWSVAWSASTGQSGTLPVASRTSEFSLLVTERQAVIRYGH